jgi:hypothetical protein
MRLTYPNDMVRALRTNEVSTLEVILYSGLYISNIVFLVLSYFSRFPLLYVPFQTQEIQLIDAVLTFILVIVELVGAYYLNDQGDILETFCVAANCSRGTSTYTRRYCLPRRILPGWV